MVEIETLLMPITFGAGAPERFLGVAQVLSDVAPLAGRYISFERLVASSLVSEEETAGVEQPPAPPPPDGGNRVLSRGPHLRLVASRSSDPLRFDSGEAIRKLLALCGAALTRRTD